MGGVYSGRWVQVISRWVTTVYRSPHLYPEPAIEHTGRPLAVLPLISKTTTKIHLKRRTKLC